MTGSYLLTRQELLRKAIAELTRELTLVSQDIARWQETQKAANGNLASLQGILDTLAPNKGKPKRKTSVTS